MQHVWDAFNELHKARGQGCGGWFPISNTEILAYCTLTGAVLRPWEYAALRALDDRWVNGPPRSTEPMTPDAFDQMFS